MKRRIRLRHKEVKPSEPAEYLKPLRGRIFELDDLERMTRYEIFRLSKTYGITLPSATWSSFSSLSNDAWHKLRLRILCHEKNTDNLHET